MKQLALLLLPVFWRKPVFTSVLYAGVSELSRIHTRFMIAKQENEYRLTHNGQVCYLRAALNDAFDPLERRITITDTDEDVGNLIIHNRDAEQKRLVPNRGGARRMIMNRRGFGGAWGIDFWINLPIASNGRIDLTRLKAVVGTYKLISKRFSITYK